MPKSNDYRTLANPFAVTHTSNIEDIIALLTEAIETFEAQSGTGEGEEYFTNRTRLFVYNNTNLNVEAASIDEVYGAKAGVWQAARKAAKATPTINEISSTITEANAPILNSLNSLTTSNS